MTRPKPLLLLTYLALEGRKPRKFMAELFFAEAKDPADSLSTTVRRLGSSAEAIAVDEGFLACTLPCDANELLTLLDAGEYERALELYKGPFVEGLGTALFGELEEWVYATREYLAKRVRGALLHLAEAALARGEREPAARHCRWAYTLTEASEPEPHDLNRLYRLFQAVGDGRAAEVREDAARFGIDVDAEAKAVPVFEGVSVRHTLPELNTPLVGRDLELVEIAGALAYRNCRLLTVHGAGGVGKTRLAVQAAYEHLGEPAFSEGTAFVPLEALTHPEQLPHAIASALALPPLASSDPWVLLVEQLANRRLLLVLDNAEHLISVAPRLNDLLSGCPELTLLVTSRERLNLTAEWLLTLDGLPVPDDEAGLTDALAGDAVNLFVQRAKRVRLSFAPTAADLPFVLRICRAVDGFPLGVELAAAWVRAMPLADLAATLEESVTVLDTTLRDVSTRHRSLLSAFQHSWNLLTAREQVVLRRLAVFRGGFRREAAAVVAGATIPDLVGLVDKSLLRVLPDGRFDQHALLAQFTREMLSQHPLEESEALEKHGAYFTELLMRTQAQAHGAAFAELFALLAEEESNLLAFFDWAVANERSEELLLLSEPLLWYFPQSGRFHDGIRVFGGAIEQLPVTRPKTERALSSLLVSHAWLSRLVGDVELAMRNAARAVELARAPGSEVELMRGLDLLAQSFFFGGRYHDSLSPALEGLAYARERDDDPVRLNRFLVSTAYAEGFLGELGPALEHAKEALSLYETGRIPRSMDLVATLMCSGAIYICLEEWQRARDDVRLGIQVSEEIGYAGTIPLLKSQLTHALFELGLAEADEALIAEARYVCGEATPQARASGEQMSLAMLQGMLGRFALRDGRLDEADDSFREALHPPWRTRNWLTLFWVLPWLADLYLERGEHTRAGVLVGAITAHNATPVWGKQRAERLHSRLVRQLGAAQAKVEIARGASLPVDLLMTSVVGLGDLPTAK
ncbi:MAG: AAA family ATPase [Trueperaceae bacterium]